MESLVGARPAAARPLRSHFPARPVWVSAGSSGPGRRALQAGLRQWAGLSSGQVKERLTLRRRRGGPTKGLLLQRPHGRRADGLAQPCPGSASGLSGWRGGPGRRGRRGGGEEPRGGARRRAREKLQAKPAGKGREGRGPEEAGGGAWSSRERSQPGAGAGAGPGRRRWAGQGEEPGEAPKAAAAVARARSPPARRAFPSPAAPRGAGSGGPGRPRPPARRRRSRGAAEARARPGRRRLPRRPGPAWSSSKPRTTTSCSRASARCGAAAATAASSCDRVRPAARARGAGPGGGRGGGAARAGGRRVRARELSSFPEARGLASARPLRGDKGPAPHVASSAPPPRGLLCCPGERSRPAPAPTGKFGRGAPGLRGLFNPGVASGKSFAISSGFESRSRARVIAPVLWEVLPELLSL